MSSASSRRFRGARNALIDALGLGETYPVQDLPVSCEPPVVPFGSVARVELADSERGVVYRLRDQEGGALPRSAAPQGDGTGETLAIETPRVEEDATFTVLAAKPSGRTARLLATGSVKVGLDAALPVALLPAGGGPHVIDHAAGVTVQIEHSQEGVDYRLVQLPPRSRAAPDDVAAMAADVVLSVGGTAVGGTGGPIQLLSAPLTEDLEIRVRALKTFGGGRNARPPQTTLLTGKLPVFVRPDRKLKVSAKPPIVDHAAGAVLQIAGSQAGVAYLAQARAIADPEFDRAEPPPPEALPVTAPQGAVRVRPASPGASFDRRGAPAPGTGATLALPLPPLIADSLFGVEASKAHVGGPAGLTSTVVLEARAVVLVRPSARPPLRLEATLAADTLVRLRALGGEAGVFYALTPAGESKPLGALYLHKIDALDPRSNKGTGQLAIDVDWVVASDEARPASTAASPPSAPALDVAPARPLPAEFAVGARRAQTGLKADLAAVARISALPKSTVEPAEIAAGGSARVTLGAAPAGEHFALLVDGRPVAPPTPGTRAALVLQTGPLAAGARLELWAGEGDDSGPITVERRTVLSIKVT